MTKKTKHTIELTSEDIRYAIHLWLYNNDNIPGGISSTEIVLADEQGKPMNPTAKLTYTE